MKIAICIVVHRGHVLCIRRSKRSDRAGEWESPAGHIDEGESPAEAALREVYEETALRVKLSRKALKITLRDGNKGCIFLGHPIDNLDVRLNPDEHDAFKWLALDELSSIDRCPPNFEVNIRKVLEMNTKKKTAAAFAETRGFGALPEDLNDAVLIGDEVEIFMNAHQDGYSTDGPLRGTVDRLGNHFFWIRQLSDAKQPGKDEPALLQVDWRNRGKWDVIRIRRGQTGQKFTYEKVGTGEGQGQTNGIALLIEPDLSTPNEAMFQAFPGVSPDLNNFAAQQIPSTMAVVVDSPAYDYGYRTVRSILQDNGLLDGYTMSQGSRGRVLILTTEPDTKSQIRSVLKNHGKKVSDLKGGKVAGLVVAEKMDLQVLELASLVMLIGRQAKDPKVQDELMSSAYEFLRKETGVTEGQATMMLARYRKFVKAADLKGFLKELVDRGYNIPNLGGVNPKNVLQFAARYLDRDEDAPIVASTRKALVQTPMAPAAPGQKPSLSLQIPTPQNVQTQSTPQGVTMQTQDPAALQDTLKQLGQVDQGLQSPQTPGSIARAATRTALLLHGGDLRGALQELRNIVGSASTDEILKGFRGQRVSSQNWQALGDLALSAGEFGVYRVLRRQAE